MIEIKELLKKYGESCTTREELTKKANPLLQVLGKLSTAQSLMNEILNESMSLPDNYGVKELRCKIENTLVWLNDYENDKLTKEIMG